MPGPRPHRIALDCVAAPQAPARAEGGGGSAAVPSHLTPRCSARLLLGRPTRNASYQRLSTFFVSRRTYTKQENSGTPKNYIFAQLTKNRCKFD